MIGLSTAVGLASERLLTSVVGSASDIDLIAGLQDILP